MASAVATERLRSRLAVYSHDHDPGATTAILCSPDGGTTIRSLDMRDHLSLMVVAKPNVVAAGGLTKLEIVASETDAFSSVTVIKDSGVVAADALQDNVVLECSPQEIAHLGEAAGLNLRYVAARLTMATATDEATVTYISEPVVPQSGLTATTIT